MHLQWKTKIHLDLRKYIWDIIIADLWNRRDVRVNAICFELSQKNSETTHHVSNGTAFSCGVRISR